MALETDLLDYPDLFEGSTVVRALQDELIAGAEAEIARVEHAGGTIAALESGLMKSALVASQAARVARIATGEQAVVGRNRYTEALPSPLVEGADGGLFRATDGDAGETLAPARAHPCDAATRRRCTRALARLRVDARDGTNLMPASIECARARVTTGEWAGALRSVFGEYRPGHRRRRPAAGARRRRGRGDPRPRRRDRRAGAGGGRGWWSASPASTATRTAPR